jgi:hypothetical protein
VLLQILYQGALERDFLATIDQTFPDSAICTKNQIQSVRPTASDLKDLGHTLGTEVTQARIAVSFPIQAHTKSSLKAQATTPAEHWGKFRHASYNRRPVW